MRLNILIADFFNVLSKFIAKDTLFLKYLVTFVPEKLKLI